MPKSYIMSLSISNYGGGPNPSGSFVFIFDGGSTTYSLDKEDVERIQALAYDCVERKKQTIVEALQSITRPALLGYDRGKTIEESALPNTDALDLDDEIPF